MFSKTTLLRSSLTVGLALGLCVGCASGGLRTATNGADDCALLDSSFTLSGFTKPLVFAGKATIDANQYRVRGVVRLETEPPGSVYIEFSSSMLFGSRIEDFFCSIVDDTLRIIDRERGQFFEGESAERFLREQLLMDFAIRQTLKLALGGYPDCTEISELEINARSDGRVITGRTEGQSFRVEFAPDERLERILWPIPDDPDIRDRLRVDYEWADGPGAVLKRMTIFLEKREWRCKLIAVTSR